MKIPRAPGHLSREAKQIWSRLAREWSLDEAMCITLRVALEAWDRLQVARQTIDREGPVYETATGFKREHPALKIEKESRSGFLQAWRLLGLGLEEGGEIGRPPGS